MSKKNRNLPESHPAPQDSSAGVSRGPIEWAVWAGLLAAVFAVYSNVGQYAFVTFDDPIYVVRNAEVQKGLTAESIESAFRTAVDANWVPLTMISHMAVADAAGLSPSAHHRVNLLLHIAATLLLFAGLRRATGGLWESAFVALIFGIHPLHVESVAWVSERKDVLSTCFWFAGLYAYIRYAEKPSAARYMAVFAALCLGLMAKPMLVTFPFTLLLLDFWPLRRMAWPGSVVEKIPLFATITASSAVTYLVQRSAGAVRQASWTHDVENALVSYVSYIGQMVWPVNLSFLYPDRQWLAAVHAIGAAVMVLAISGVAVMARKTRPYLTTGWFWYLGTLVPVIGFVQVGAQSHADRYMYVPMVGLTIVVAWGAADVVKRHPQSKVWVGVAGALTGILCFFAASAQVEVWRNSETLYTRALEVNPENYFAESMLADYLTVVPGRIQDAAVHYAAAQREQPDSADAHFNLGLIAEKLPNGLKNAEAHYRAALKQRPDWARAHKQLGLLLMKTGRADEGMAELAAGVAGGAR